jgi:hypothetical protein
VKFLLLFLISFSAYAQKLFSPDFKTSVELTAVGADDSYLLNDDKIKLSGIGQTLRYGIENDLLGTGGSGANISTKTTTYSITDADDVIVANSSSGAFTLTLPACTEDGKVINVIKSNSELNKVTLQRAGSDTILHTSSLTAVGLFTEGESWVMSCRVASNLWVVESHYAETPFISYGAISIGSTGGTPPGKGTTVIDDVSCSRSGAYATCWYKYEHSSAGTAGTAGHYLYGTPTGIDIDHYFETDAATNNAAQSELQKAILHATGHITNTSSRGHLHAFAYDANRFRMAGVLAFTDYGMVRNASVYPMSATNYAFGLIVRYKVSGWDE